MDLVLGVDCVEPLLSDDDDKLVDGVRVELVSGGTGFELEVELVSGGGGSEDEGGTVGLVEDSGVGDGSPDVGSGGGEKVD